MGAQDVEPGKRLQALRDRKGWSRETLAYRADVSAKTIERIEKGEVEGRRGTFRQIAEALEVDVFAIIGEPRGPFGVPLSGQIDGGFEEFRAHVATINERFDKIETALEAAASEREAILALLAEQSQLIERISDLVAVLQDVKHVERAAAAAVRSLPEWPQRPGGLAPPAPSSKRAG